MKIPWKVILLIAGVWIGAYLIIVWSHSIQPTPASLEKYLARHDLNQASGSDRTKIIEHAAEQLNRLSLEQRQQLSSDGTDRQFVEKMTSDERAHFMDLTLPEGFHQLIMALNKMTPEKRRQIVQTALDNIHKANPPPDGQRPDNDQAQQIVSKGLDTFYKDSSPEVKLDFAPVIEEIQKSTESSH